MEATALSVGKSVLSGALSYAKSALAEEVALQLGVRRDQLFITNELEMMQAFLMAAHDERDDNMVVKVWVKQVRDVAYDVEDTLQDFAVRLEKQSWWRIRRTLLDRRHVAKQMKELRANVEDVSQRNMRYHLIKGSASKLATVVGQSAITGATMSGNDEARRQRDKAKVDLVRLINKKDDNLRVVAVSGTSIAHLGETSFIKRVYDDLKMHNKFECHAWISLTCPFNLTDFLRSIIEQFHLNFLQDQEAGEKGKTSLQVQVLRKMGMMKEDDLVAEFTRYVNEKTYLIVLNDIRTIEEWGHIKPCFRNNNKGSRIIVSAEQVGVASLCVGPEDAALEYKQLFVDQNLYAFYEKGSQDRPYSMEAGSSSNSATAGTSNRKMLNRAETMLAAIKECQIIGRETEKSEIIKLITNEDSQQLEVISVWGMGGLGKTTLVRDVYQNQELSGKFEKRACVTIMRPFNLDELLKNLATQFGCNVTDLVKHLEGKKCFIVLDDISSNTEWDAIVPHFPAMQTSSRIIVTTRVKDIAKHCSKKHDKMYELQILGHKDARDLFMEKVFDKTTNLDEQYPELVEQAEFILRKCRGLPLAVATIAGFLANQPKTTLEWRKLNENISTELEMNSELETIRTVLIKSYDGLPYHLKSCFLYLSIFPEDHVISCKRLLRRWTAEGFSGVARNKSRKDIAESYFMELISRSMLLPSEQIIYGRKEIDFCQVHDLIREIGISKSMEENLVFRLEEGCTLNTEGTARHLAINGNWEGDQCEFESIVDMSRVRSITVFGHWRPFFISDKMRLLRVLDLEDTRGLVDHHLEHIGKLLHLRYLSVRGNEYIFNLPDSVGNLRQLETLDIRDTRIVMLPKTIVKLQKLNNLRAGRKPENESVSYDEQMERNIPPVVVRNKLCLFVCCSMLSCLVFCAPKIFATGDPSSDDLPVLPNRRDVCAVMWCYLIPSLVMRLEKHGILAPRGMRKLTALHSLGIVNIAQRGKVFLQEIKGLSRLCKLTVTGINKENGQELCAAIVGLSRLESLSIRSEGEPGLSGCLDGWFPFPRSLQSLKLYGNLVKLPQWVHGLNNLVKLKLRSTSISDHNAAIRVLGDLPNLAFLHLLWSSFQRAQEDPLNFHQESFPSLVVLELDDVNNITSLKFEKEATPKLELLKLCLRDIDSETISGLPSLSSLKEVVLEGNYHDSKLEYLSAELAKNPNRPVWKRV